MFCDDYYVWTTALEDQDQARQFCNDEIGVDEIQGKWNEERVLAYIMMHGDPRHVEKALSIVDAEDDLLADIILWKWWKSW